MSRTRPLRRRFDLDALESRRLPSSLTAGHLAATTRHLDRGHRSDPADRPAVAGPTELRNLAYPTDSGGSQRLDVILPGGPRPAGGWPVLLAIHGGGWRRFSKEQYEPHVDPLTRSGFAVVAVDYTLSAPGHSSWPSALDDVRDAALWIRSEAPSLHLDAGRVAAIGESAGGHLAALLGTDPGSAGASVDAVVDFYGPADLAALDAQSDRARPAVEQFLGGPPSGRGRADPPAPPRHHVRAGDPPFLIVHGAADTIVPPAQSEALDAALRGAGVPSSLILVPGAGHGFGLRVGGIDLAPRVVAFLDDALNTR